MVTASKRGGGRGAVTGLVSPSAREGGELEADDGGVGGWRNGSLVCWEEAGGGAGRGGGVGGGEEGRGGGRGERGGGGGGGGLRE